MTRSIDSDMFITHPIPPLFSSRFSFRQAFRVGFFFFPQQQNGRRSRKPKKKTNNSHNDNNKNNRDHILHHQSKYMQIKLKRLFIHLIFMVRGKRKYLPGTTAEAQRPGPPPAPPSGRAWLLTRAFIDYKNKNNHFHSKPD